MSRHIYQTRRRNLRRLAAEHGTHSALAAVLGISSSHLSQIIGRNPTRNVGDALSRRIEKATGKPENWMDEEHCEVNAVPVGNGPQHRELPKIAWSQIKQWSLMNEEEGLYVHAVKRFSTTKNVGERSFVLEVLSDSMEPRIPQGAHIVVDPDYEPGAGRAVIVSLNAEHDPMLRQLVIEGGQTYLKALNPRYPILSVTEQGYTLHGVVRQVILDLD